MAYAAVHSGDYLRQISPAAVIGRKLASSNASLTGFSRISSGLPMGQRDCVIAGHHDNAYPEDVQPVDQIIGQFPAAHFCKDSRDC